MGGKQGGGRQSRKQRGRQQRRLGVCALSLVRAVQAGNGVRTRLPRTKFRRAHHIIFDSSEGGFQKLLELLFMLVVEKARDFGDEARVNA